MRGFGLIGLLAIIAILAGNLVFQPLSALLVLAWAYASETPWSAIGLDRPRSRALLAAGIIGGVLLKLLLKALVMPLLGGPAINPHYHYLAGNAAALPGMLYAVLIGAAFGEEVVFRGFLFDRMRALLGWSLRTRLVILVVTTALFAAAHLPDQGWPGAEQAAVTGLVFGAAYLLTGQLWLSMALHAAFDLTAVVLIYENWEDTVAHWLFR